MFRHLLVPLDGSRLAETILPVAIAFGRELRARLTLLHVIERDAPGTVHGDRHLDNSAEARRYLAGIAADLASADLPVDSHCHTAAVADVARSIVDHAAELGADLVALCTHGQGGLRTALLGSIAQQVLRLGTMPVLIVRPALSGSVTAFAPRTVLVPLDRSPEGEEALAIAAELAGRFGAAVHLLCVVPTQTTVRGDLAASARLLPSATAAILDLATEEARRYVAAGAERLTEQGVEATGEVRRGDVIDQLAMAAANADLLVMATHGQAGLGALWSGSVAARLLGRVSCPALLLRALRP